jgi:DNA (cytosine-5)-methyltransferase 1
LGVDIHSPSIASFRKNHPEAAAVLGDIAKVTEANVRSLIGDNSVTAITAGVPCQGFSVSNRKRWQDDERNFLFKEFVRFVEMLRPKVILLENVSGMRSTKGGQFVRDITKAMSEAGDGYVVQSKLLNSADYGVPQSRRRLIFIGHLKNGSDEFKFSWPKATHLPSIEGQKTLWDGMPHYVTVGEAFCDLPRLERGESASKYTIPASKASDYARIMRGAKRTFTNHDAGKGTQATSNRVASTEQGEPMYPKFRQRIRLHMNRPSPTIVSGGIRPQFQLGHPLDARGLTVRERARIMSFPDSFVFEGGVVMGRVQTGQAVPPLLAKAVAEQVLKIIMEPEPEFAIIHDNTPGTAVQFRDSHQRLEDAELLTFTQGLKRWPHLRERAVPYDTPDIILVRRSDGEPFLVLEETTDSCSSDKAFQRYARMRGAAENGLIGLHAQRLALRSGKQIYYLNLRLPQAFRVLEERHPDSSVSYVVYPLNAGLTPTDRSDADQWQTDEGDQDTMWQRIGSVVGILVDGLDAGLSMAQINQNVRSSSTRAAFDADLENWVAHVQRSRSEGGLGYTSYRSRYANHPTAFRTWTQAEALSAGIPAEIVGESTHVHRYLLETDAYMRPQGGTPGDPYAGHSYGLRTLYVEGSEVQHPFILHLSGITCVRWDAFTSNPEIKAVRMLRNSVEGVLLSDGFRTIPTASQN